MKFADPKTLWLVLALVPLLIAFLWWTWRTRQRLVTQFIQPRLLAGLMAGVSLTRRKTRLGLIVLAVTLSLVALARPQWGFDWEEVKQRGLDIVVAIDTSRSMLAEDVKPDRLTKAKYAALDLMQQAKSDRLGLVAFAGTAFLQCPLTVDDEAFREETPAAPEVPIHDAVIRLQPPDPHRRPFWQTSSLGSEADPERRIRHAQAMDRSRWGRPFTQGRLPVSPAKRETGGALATTLTFLCVSATMTVALRARKPSPAVITTSCSAVAPRGGEKLDEETEARHCT